MKKLDIEKLEKELIEELQTAIANNDEHTINDFKPTAFWAPEDAKMVYQYGTWVINDPKYPEQTIREIKNRVYNEVVLFNLYNKNLNHGDK